MPKSWLHCHHISHGCLLSFARCWKENPEQGMSVECCDRGHPVMEPVLNGVSIVELEPVVIRGWLEKCLVL